MSVKTKEHKIHPFERIADWSVTNKGVVLYVNPPIRSYADGISLDIEHDEKGGFVGIGIYEPLSNSCFYFSDRELAKQLTIPRFVAHNGVSDIYWLQQWGFNVHSSTHLIWDSCLMAHILDSSLRDYGLKTLCKNQLGAEWPSYKEIVGVGKAKKTLDSWPVEAVSEYNSCDTYWTYQLYLKQRKQVSEGIIAVTSLSDIQAIRYYEKIEAPVSSVFQEMENRGITINVEYLTSLKDSLERQKAPIEAEIHNELGNINLNSPKQLIGALHAKEIYPIFKGKASTDKRALSQCNDSGIVRKLLEYSEVETLLSSFVRPYLERRAEIVHPKFNQVGTRTGRPSCSDPNLLQIPRRTENGKLVRRMFIPRRGYILGDCDYGQIEPRVLAHLSKDTNMCKLFIEGVDFHTFTSERLCIDRERAKILNLSVGYRATFKSVSTQLKCSEREAQQQIDAWWETFPELRLWQDRLIWQSKKTGYCTTLMGRQIKIEGLGDFNKWKREHAQRVLLNNIIQGSAAEIMKVSMKNVVNNPTVHLLVQVYDELLFETPVDDAENILQMVIFTMENAVKLDVPLVVEGHLGMDWASCKS